MHPRYKFIVKRLDLEPQTLRDLEVELTNATMDEHGHWSWDITQVFTYAGYIVFMIESRGYDQQV